MEEVIEEVNNEEIITPSETETQEEEKKEIKITLGEVIQAVKGNKLGVSDKDILKFINDFEADVQMNVLKLKAEELIRYTLDDQLKELIIPFPFTDVYELYCEAMINYSTKEFTAYNQANSMLETRYKSYKNYVMNKDYEDNGFMKYM